MEALYSPRTQTFALIPRFSPLSSSSFSSSSVRLSISRIHSIRNDFLGCGHNLRLRSRRKCKILRLHTTQVSNLRLVASLESLPIVAVVVAVTVSAIAFVYSSFFKRKKDSEQVSGPPVSRYNQEGRETSKQGFRSQNNADRLYVSSLKESNYLLQEVGDSSPEDRDGRVKLSYVVPSSIPEDTPNVEQEDARGSQLNDLGAIALSLSKKSEELDAVQIHGLYTEDSEFANSGQETDLDPPSPAPIVEMKDNVSVLADTSPVKDQDHGESNHEHAESQHPETDLNHLSPASISEIKDAVPVLAGAAPVMDENHVESNYEYVESQLQETDLNSLASMVEMEDAVPVLADASPIKDQNHGESNHEYEESELQETDLNHLSPAAMVEMKDTVSVPVHTAPAKDQHEEACRKHDEGQPQAPLCSKRIKSGREELYVFYEGTSVLDRPEVLNGLSGLSFKASLLENNDKPITTRNAVPRMPVNKTSAAGNGRHVSVAPDTGGAFHQTNWKGKGSPMSETKGSSFRSSHQKSLDVPNTSEIQVNGQHTAFSDLSSYNRLLRRGRINECIELLEDMNRKDVLDMSKIYHAKFFDICRSQKAVKEAFRFAKLIPNPTLSTFNMLMSVCSRAQDSEGAFEVSRLVQAAALKADCKLYTTLISTCAKSGKVDTMFEVFHEMVNCGVEPNVHTYGALIDGCARAGQVAKAFGAYGILRSKNVKPDRVVFNALITACGQCGAVERAFDVLAEMRAEAHPIDPDHVTVGALIRACMSAGQVDRVKGVYEMTHKYKIKGTPELYTIAVNSCSETGDWDLACNIYSDMKKKGVLPDEMFFSALIDVAGHAGNLDASFEVLQDARAQGINPGIISYSSLMGACSKTKNCEKALELFEQIKALKLTPTISTMNALLTALCDAEQMQKAMDVFSEMKQLGLSPNNITYSILIGASEKNDDLEAGLTLFAQAKEDGVPLSLKMCRCLIRMCSRRFDKASALGEPVLSFKSGRPQIDSKWTLLTLRIYREIIGTGLIPSTETLSQVLGCLQLPQDMSLKKRLTENLGINTETSRSSNLFSLIDGFGEYDPRAFSLFEEAASLGTVPGVSLKENPISIDARSLNIHIAEVYILTVLKGMKHRLAAGAKLSSITITLPVETTEISCPKGEKTINVSGRVSQAVGALLRRIRLPYQGNESHGKIKITGLAVKRWFQPKLVPSFSGEQAQMGLSQSRLSKGITHQQRNIRTGNLSLD